MESQKSMDIQGTHGTQYTHNTYTFLHFHGMDVDLAVAVDVDMDMDAVHEHP